MTTAPPQSRARRARRPQKKRSQAPIIIGAVAVVVILGLVAILASRGGTKKKSEVTTSASAAAEVQPVQVSGTALASLPSSGSDPAIGKPAPELRGKTFDGSAQSITADGRGKLILFIAHWCPHCQREVPLVAGWLNGGGKVPAGVDIVAVSTQVDAAAGNYPPSDWLQREKWPVPTMADDQKSDAARAFGLTGFPFYVVVDRTGKVVDRTSGEHPLADVQAMLKEAANAA